MMDFIVLTLSITAAIMLSMVLSFVLMTNPKVVKLYTNYVLKTVEKIAASLEEDHKGEL